MRNYTAWYGWYTFLVGHPEMMVAFSDIGILNFKITRDNYWFLKSIFQNGTSYTSFHQHAMCFPYYNTTAHVLLQYRSATYTTFLPSLKYTLIQTECSKTKSKHLNASKCLRTSFVAKEISRTKKIQNINEQYC